MTLGAYVRAWKRVLAAPAGAVFPSSLCFLSPTSREEILLEFSFGVDDRIDRHIPGFGVGRKTRPDWQREMIHASRQVNTPGLILDWLPADLLPRFADRLRRNRDDL